MALTYPSSFHEAFTDEEMKILGAHVYGFQKLPKNSPRHTTNKPAPWTPYARLLRALRALTEAGVEFRTARYEAPMHRVAMAGILDPVTVRESKKVFDKIIAWDEAYLEGLVKGSAGKFNETELGFAASAPEPLQGNFKKVVVRPAQLTEEEPKKEEASTDEPETEKRKPGRPPKEKHEE